MSSSVARCGALKCAGRINDTNPLTKSVHCFMKPWYTCRPIACMPSAAVDERQDPSCAAALSRRGGRARTRGRADGDSLARHPGLLGVRSVLECSEVPVPTHHADLRRGTEATEARNPLGLGRAQCIFRGTERWYRMCREHCTLASKGPKM